MKRSSSLDVQSSPTSWEYSSSCLGTVGWRLWFQSLSKIGSGIMLHLKHRRKKNLWVASHTSVHSVFCTSPCQLRWVAAAAAGGCGAFSHSGCQRKRRTDPSSPQRSFLSCLEENTRFAYYARIKFEMSNVPIEKYFTFEHLISHSWGKKNTRTTI